MCWLFHVCWRLYVDTNTCNTQIGCAILQKQPDGSEKKMGYWSCSLSAVEQTCNTTPCQCILLVWAVLPFAVTKTRSNRFWTLWTVQIWQHVADYDYQSSNLTPSTMWIQKIKHLTLYCEEKLLEMIKRQLRTKYQYSASLPLSPQRTRGDSYDCVVFQRPKLQRKYWSLQYKLLKH